MKILIVDDDALVRTGIKTIIEAEAGKRKVPVEISGLGQDGHEAIELYKTHGPDLVLMDIRMEGMDGIQAAEAILDLDPGARIIFLTTFLEDDYISRALKIGAKGYIIKTDFQTIFPALEAVINGQSIFGDEIVQRLPVDFSTGSKIKNFNLLTEKENELVYWIAQGLTNQELAEKLHFSEGTIRNYISLILDKLDLRNRTELAIYYYKH